ncbi:MAG: DUF6188 family protein [Gaiellaceae bacterium]
MATSAAKRVAMPPRSLRQDLPFVGLRVGRQWLDQGWALELHPSQPPADDAAVVRFLWKPFVYTDAQGTAHTLLPHEHSSLVPVFALIGAHVARAAVADSGDLEIDFNSGAQIRASELEDGWEYEQPWHFRSGGE